jgi:hypothetical protein
LQNPAYGSYIASFEAIDKFLVRADRETQPLSAFSPPKDSLSKFWVFWHIADCHPESIKYILIYFKENLTISLMHA